MTRFNSIIYIFVSSLLLTACVQEQEAIFSEPAAVRLNNAIGQIESSLTLAPNGWLMQYFAKPESPGYSMLIRFSENGEVVIAAKNALVNNRYTESKSVFEIIGDNGPVLTFNTYNEVLHLFSTPENPAGIGLGGDYEFIVTSHSDDFIRLKGKKRNTQISLIKLPADELWTEYLAAIENMQNSIIGETPLYFMVEGIRITATNGSSLVFDLQDNTINEATQVPFIISKTGIKFYAPFVISEEKAVQSFTLSSDGLRLVADNDNSTYFVSTPITTYLLSTNSTFVIDTLQMSDHFKIPYNQLAEQMKTRYNGNRNIDFIALSYKTGFGNSFLLSTIPTVTKANFKIDLTSRGVTSNEMTIKQTEGVYDLNGELFFNQNSAIDVFWKALDGSYLLSSTLSMREIRFTDKNNESRFFVVKKR